MKELGNYLKEIRENNGVSIEEAADDLEVDSFLLESLEEGNVRAFKDVLSIKEKVREYAKYLGLNPDEVADEFNDFLFEHTSKISLSDILEAEKEKNKEKNKEKDNTSKKVISPYTRVKKKKINKKALYSVIGIILLFVVIILILINIMKPKEEKIVNELFDIKIEGDIYELSN